MTDIQKQIIIDKANLVVRPAAREAGKLCAINPNKTASESQPVFTVDRNCKRTEIDSELYIRQIAPYMPAFSWVDGKPTIDTQQASTNQYLFPFAAENNYSIKSGLSVELDASTAGSELITNGDCESALPSFDGQVFSGYHATITQSSEQAQTGTYSQKSVATDSNLSTELSISTADLNKLYKVSFWIYVPSGIAGNFYINKRENGIVTSLDILTTTDSWVNYSYYINSYGTGNSSVVYVNPTGAVAGDYFYIDNVSVKEVSAFNSPFKDSTGNVVKCGRKLVESDASAGNIEHYLDGSNISATTGDDYSTFYIVKPDGRDWVRVLTGLGAVDKWVWFDIKNGIIGTTGVGSGTNDVIPFIEKFANGFYKVGFTGKVEGTYANGRPKIFLANGDGVTSYTGDGVSGVYIAGIQFEEGNPTAFINSPADAEGNTVERLGESEVATYSGNQDSGVLFIHSKDFGKDSYISISDGTINNKINLYLNSANNLFYGRIDANGVSITNQYVAIPTGNDKLAIRFDINTGIDIWLNGTKKPAFSGTFAFSNALTVVRLDRGDGSAYSKFIGNTEILATLDYLTDVEMTKLTS